MLLSRFECLFSMTLLPGGPTRDGPRALLRLPAHGRGVIENKHSSNGEMTIHRNRDVRENEGKCSYDGMVVVRQPRSESARLYEHSH